MQQEPTSRFVAFFIDACIFAAVLSLFPSDLKPWYGVIFGSYKVACELIARRSIGQALLGVQVVYRKTRTLAVLRNAWWFVPLGFQALVLIKGLVVYFRKDSVLDSLTTAQVLKAVPSAPCPTCS